MTATRTTAATETMTMVSLLTMFEKSVGAFLGQGARISKTETCN